MADTPTNRYASVTNPTGAVDNKTTGVTTGTGTSTGTTGSTTNTNQNQTSTQNQTTTNMDGASLALLQHFIQQLMGQSNQDNANKQGEISYLQGQQGAYSKPAAFADAQGLIAQQMRRSLEAMLPSINRASEDAGSSGGALRALLLQDAADKAAESSSALGVQTATNYGNVSGNFSQVLEKLLSSPTGSAQALAQAFGVLKGAVSNTTGTTESNTSGTSVTAGTTANTDSKSATENKVVDYAPFNVTSSGPQNSGGIVSYGPTQDLNSLSKDLLSQMSTTRAFDGLFI